MTKIKLIYANTRYKGPQWVQFFKPIYAILSMGYHKIELYAIFTLFTIFTLSISNNLE